MQFRKRKSNSIGIDITPLIDVIFLLLIFFMISTTFISATGIRIDLPTATSNPNRGKQKTLEVAITAKHKLYFGGQPIRRSQLKNALIKAKKNSSDGGLIIRADGKAQHKIVVFVMDVAKQAGIHKFSIATKQAKEN